MFRTLKDGSLQIIDLASNDFFCHNSTQLTAFQVNEFNFTAAPQCSFAAITLQGMQCGDATQRNATQC